MENLPPEIYTPIAAALTAVIALLYKNNSEKQKMFIELQNSNMKMVLKESKEATEMARVVLTEENKREELLNKVERLEEGQKIIIEMIRNNK